MGANTVDDGNSQSGPNATTDPRDAPVMDAIARGDLREAVGICAREHGAALGRVCMAMVGSQQDAQRLAQESLLLAHDSLASFTGEETVRVFLLGIARRVCSRHVEMQQGRSGATDASNGADGAVRERATKARAALNKLRPTERDAVVLRFHGEIQLPEVAQACGIDGDSAQQRVSRAIARLREGMA